LFAMLPLMFLSVCVDCHDVMISTVIYWDLRHVILLYITCWLLSVDLLCPCLLYYVLGIDSLMCHCIQCLQVLLCTCKLTQILTGCNSYHQSSIRCFKWIFLLKAITKTGLTVAQNLVRLWLQANPFHCVVTLHLINYMIGCD
jgi:hypothetical protein